MNTNLLPSTHTNYLDELINGMLKSRIYDVSSTTVGRFTATNSIALKLLVLFWDTLVMLKTMVGVHGLAAIAAIFLIVAQICNPGFFI